MGPNEKNGKFLFQYYMIYSVFKVSRNGRERRFHTFDFLYISDPTPRIWVAKRSRMGVPTPNFLYFNHSIFYKQLRRLEIWQDSHCCYITLCTSNEVHEPKCRDGYTHIND